MLKPLLLLSAVALLVIVSLPAPANPPQATSAGHSKSASAAAKAAAAAEAQAMAKAKQVYSIDCALCHGDNGDGKTEVAKANGYTLDDWTDSKTLSARQDQELFNVIRNGKGNMPPEGTGRATDAEVKNLITYIRGFAKSQSAAAPGTPATSASSAPSSPNNR